MALAICQTSRVERLKVSVEREREREYTRVWRDKIGERESISEWRLRDREKERERELWFGRTGVSEAA